MLKKKKTTKETKKEGGQKRRKKQKTDFIFFKNKMHIDKENHHKGKNFNLNKHHQ